MGKLKYKCGNCGREILVYPEEVEKGPPECCGEGMKKIFEKPPCAKAGDPEQARLYDKDEPCKEQEG